MDRSRTGYSVRRTVIRSDQMASLQRRQRFLHPGNRATKHSLDWIGDQGVFHRNDEVDEFEILFQPAPDAIFQIVQVFEHDGAFALLSKVRTVLPRNSSMASHSSRQRSEGSKSR